MCDPLSIGIATAALGAASTVSEYVGQNNLSKANEQAANYNYARERDAVGRQDVQLQQENSEQAFDTAITTASNRGKIAVSAAEGGLAPSSLVTQLNADMFGVARNYSADQTNFRNQRNQLAENRTDAEIKRQNQIASKPRASVAGLVIGLGKAGLSGFNANNAAAKA